MANDQLYEKLKIWSFWYQKLSISLFKFYFILLDNEMEEMGKI